MMLENNPHVVDDGGEGGGNLLLTRQPSGFFMTFEQFQANMEGIGLEKDLGSMNMEDIKKSIWNAEELQDIGSGSGSGSGPSSVCVPGSIPQENSITVSSSTGLLEKQESLTLSKTLTIDEVWSNMSKESTNVTSSSNVLKEPTLSDFTLENFLFQAGVILDETQLTTNPTTTSFLPSIQIPEFEFQQQPADTNSGLMRSNLMENPSQFNLEPYNLPLNINEIISSLENFLTQEPKLGEEIGISDPIVVNGSLAPVGTVEEDIGNSKGNDDFVPPVPYVFNNDNIRGKRSSVERKQRRRLKNRESAARSRARKQAYTIELETDIANLKEENNQLMKKKIQLMSTEKNRLLEEMNKNNGVMQIEKNQRCIRLRRTQTGMW